MLLFQRFVALWIVSALILGKENERNPSSIWEGTFSFSENSFSSLIPNLNGQDLFLKSKPTVSVSDSEKNAAIIQAIWKETSEEHTLQKLTELKLHLASTKGYGNSTDLLNIIHYSQTNLLDYYLTNIAKMDIFLQDAILGSSPTSSRRTYRSLILGLHALSIVQKNMKGSKSQHQLHFLASLDPIEFKRFKGYKIRDIILTNSTKDVVSKSNNLISTLKQSFLLDALPKSVDWTTRNAVGPVQNQGSCGSCWAFAASSVYESRLVVKGGNLTSLSAQQLTSCASSNGCVLGGDPNIAWAYAAVTGGVTSDALYPYVSGSDSSSTPPCDSTITSGVVTSSVKSIRLTTELEIMNELFLNGPISIAISASVDCFQTYTSGVLTAQDCACYNGASSIDHAVTLVGYGTTSDGIDYFKIKNSWGTEWGMQGYVLLQRNVPPMGMCGLLTDATYPLDVKLTSECSSANSPGYCAGAQQEVMFTNMNYSNGEPLGQCIQNYAGAYEDSSCNPNGSEAIAVWAWVLIGIGCAVGCILIVLIIGCLCERYAPSDAPYNIFSRPPRDGYQLLSEAEREAGKGPLPNDHPDAFSSREERIAL